MATGGKPESEPGEFQVTEKIDELMRERFACERSARPMQSAAAQYAVPRGYLPADLQRALDQPPIALPPWDPMGALA